MDEPIFISDADLRAKANQYHIKPFEKLELKDDFMFGQVIQYPDFAKALIESIIGHRIGRVLYVNEQETIKDDYRGKGVRLDSYIRTESGNVYDIDVQNDNNDDIPKRIRIYHNVIGRKLLKTGEKYSAAKDSYVIFICDFDVFGFGDMIYELALFDCNHMHRVDNGEHSFVVNIRHTNHEQAAKNPELAALLAYMKDKDNCDEKFALVRAASTYVDEIKKNHSKELDYMLESVKSALHDEKIIAKSREEGKSEGELIYAKRLQRLTEKLHELGNIDEIVEAATNPETAKKLFVKYGI